MQLGAIAYPASITGWLILKSLVRGVEKTGGEEGMVIKGGYARRTRGPCKARSFIEDVR
jgi:hypothetical protein